MGNTVAMPPKALMRRTFIREWRKARGLTIEQLAARLDDMSPSNISMLERGERGYVQTTLERIAAALQTDVASLLSRKPTDEAPPILRIWETATPRQRKQIIDISKTITGGGDEQ